VSVKNNCHKCGVNVIIIDCLVVSQAIVRAGSQATGSYWLGHLPVFKQGYYLPP